MKKSIKQDKWEKEFDELIKLDGFSVILLSDGDTDFTNEVKSFIRQLLKKERELVIEEIIKDIEESEIAVGLGSASGGMFKGAVLRYLKSQLKK